MDRTLPWPCAIPIGHDVLQRATLETLKAASFRVLSLYMCAQRSASRALPATRHIAEATARPLHMMEATPD